MTADLFDGYVSEAEYARQRGVSVPHLRRERRIRQGPPFVKLGGAVYYSIEGIREWLRANIVNTLASQEPVSPEQRSSRMNMQTNTQALVDLGRGHLPYVPTRAPRNAAEYQEQVTNLTFLIEHGAGDRQRIVDAFAEAVSARQRGFPQNETGAAA